LPSWAGWLAIAAGGVHSLRFRTAGRCTAVPDLPSRDPASRCHGDPSLQALGTVVAGDAR